MRILQVISHYVPAYRYGGPLRVAHGLSRALVEAGHQVTVCCTNLADETSDLDVPLDTPVDVDGATVYYEPTRYSRYWGYSPNLKARVEAEVSKADVVLVHAHYQYANYVGASTARREGKPYVIFPHGSLHRCGLAHKNQILKRFYLDLFEGRNLRSALFLAFNAEEEMRESLYGDRGRVIPNGIARRDFVNAPGPGSFRERYPELRGKTLLVFLGRLDVQQKGIDFLLPAFAQSLVDHPHLHLVIAGPDEAGGLKFVRSACASHALDDSITLTGALDGQQKLALLQDADAFVLPSRFEGMSIALLEALYLGIPVAVTDQVGLCGEIKSAAAGIVVEASPAGIRSAINSMASEEVRTGFRGRGTALIEGKYTWDAIAETLTDSLSMVTSPDTPRPRN